MAYYIHPWTWRTLEYNIGLIEAGQTGPHMDHTASNVFVSRGVTVGDGMYVVSWKHGGLRVHASLIVDRLLPQKAAERVLKTSLWDADDHVIARPGSATRLCENGDLTPKQLDNFEFI